MDAIDGTDTGTDAVVVSGECLQLVGKQFVIALMQRTECGDTGMPLASGEFGLVSEVYIVNKSQPLGECGRLVKNLRADIIRPLDWQVADRVRQIGVIANRFMMKIRLKSR